MSASLIGRRLRALRKERGLSQDELATTLGFANRQTISAIERGTRGVRADELLRAMERMDVDLDYFTDPFRLVGEGRFSWRQVGVDADQLADYEHRAGRWIAAYRVLAHRVGRTIPFTRQSLRLGPHSRYEDAMAAGERFADEFELGENPARALAEVMERDLNVLVLMVDARDGVSGAACRLPDLDTVLISRRESEGRRHFDLAHELFHVLTWDSMPPGRIEEATHTGSNRVEKLANNFAAALLMPTSSLQKYGHWTELDEPDLVTRLNAAADELGVTSSALRWRLVSLNRLSQSVARSLPDANLRHNGHEEVKGDPPLLYSRPFVEIVGSAIYRGFVSVRRAARLLELTIDDMADLFVAHGVKIRLDL